MTRIDKCKKTKKHWCYTVAKESLTDSILSEKPLNSTALENSKMNLNNKCICMYTGEQNWKYQVKQLHSRWWQLCEDEKDGAQEKYQVTQQPTVVTCNQNGCPTTQWNVLLSSMARIQLNLFQQGTSSNVRNLKSNINISTLKLYGLPFIKKERKTKAQISTSNIGATFC